jgi:peptide/nickel transport system substrate-binding protein
MRTLLLFFILFSLQLYSSTLNLSISANPTRLNPLLATDSASSAISDKLFNGLFKYDKDGNVVTDLAQSYSFENNTILIISLKENVLWHDGAMFSADDVLFTYQTIISPKIFTPYAGDFKKYVKAVEKVDDLTVKIIYNEPYFKALELWMMGVIPKHILQNDPDLMTSEFNKKPIGTGAYKLDAIHFSSSIELSAFDDYFEGKAKIDKIHYRFIADSHTDFLLQKQGKIDVSSLTPLQIDRQIDEKFKNLYQIIETMSFGYTYMGFNLKNPKFKDKRVRQAINLAINKQELIDILFFGHGRVCNGPFLPGTYAYNPDIKASHYSQSNILKAKHLLKGAGYDESNPLEFELITNTGNDIRMHAAEIITYQLSLIGIKVKLRVMEWQAFLNTVIHPRNFESFILGWSMGLTPDARSIWHSSSDFTGGFNLVGYHNKEVDDLIDSGAKMTDRKELAKTYRQIYTHIAEDLPYIFLYIPNSITTVRKNIENIEPALTGISHNQIHWIKR